MSDDVQAEMDEGQVMRASNGQEETLNHNGENGQNGHEKVKHNGEKIGEDDSKVEEDSVAERIEQNIKNQAMKRRNGEDEQPKMNGSHQAKTNEDDESPVLNGNHGTNGNGEMKANGHHTMKMERKN